MSTNFTHFSFFETPTILQKLQLLKETEWKGGGFYEQNCQNYIKAKIIPVISNQWSKYDPEYLKKFHSMFENEITLLHNHFLYKFKSGMITRFVITKLPPRCVITPHIDEEGTQGGSKRYLIPIISYPDIYYEISDEQKCIPANEMWEINSSKHFAVRNYSHTDSLHITVDWKLEA